MKPSTIRLAIIAAAAMWLAIFYGLTAVIWALTG